MIQHGNLNLEKVLSFMMAVILQLMMLCLLLREHKMFQNLRQVLVLI